MKEPMPKSAHEIVASDNNIITDIPEGRVADKPRLSCLGVFEGPVKIEKYKDYVKVTGRCVHCSNQVGQGLRLHGPMQITDERTQEQAIEAACDRLVQNHECAPVIHDGKTVDTDFLKGLSQ